jgi:hypothetical protein
MKKQLIKIHFLLVKNKSTPNKLSLQFAPFFCEKINFLRKLTTLKFLHSFVIDLNEMRI